MQNKNWITRGRDIEAAREALADSFRPSPVKEDDLTPRERFLLAQAEKKTSKQIEQLVETLERSGLLSADRPRS